MDVVRRRVIRCSGPKVLDIEDDLLDVDAARATAVAGGRRRRAAGHAGPGQERPDARHRRHDPARAGRGDPGAGRRGDPDRGRPGHRQDRGGAAPGGAPALPRPAPVRGRRRAAGRAVPGVHVLCGARAAVARARRPPSCARSGAIVDGVTSRPARPARAGRAQGFAADAPVPAAGRPAGAAGRADRAAASCTAARCCGCGADELDRVRPRAARAGAAPQRGRPGGAARAGPGAVGATARRASPWTTKDVRRRSSTTGTSSSGSPGRGGRCSRRSDVLGWLGDADRVRDAGRDWLSHRGRRRAGRVLVRVPGDLSVADVALLDELRALLGEPPRPNRRRARGRSMGIDFAGDDIRELSTVTERYYAAPERPHPAGQLRRVRARAGRRGAGPLADAVADARPARAAGQLDDRRRRRPERLAGPRPRPAGRGRRRCGASRSAGST